MLEWVLWKAKKHKLVYNCIVSLIEVKNLTYSYDGKTNAVDDVTFNIEKGDYVTVIGHNGSGKSTLAKLLAGLLESKSGKVIIDSLELNEDNIYKIREKLGIVFQNPDNQFIGSTVEDDIAFGLENHQVPSKDMKEIIEEYAKRTGLEDYLKKEPTALSGGQKQRVAIAGVLAMHPNIIIFDEATSMLDPKGKRDIKALINDLHKNKDFTIVSITHDIEEVLHSDDCIVMNKGKMFDHDTPEKIFSDPERLRKIDLDIPFDLKIVEEFKKCGVKLKSKTQSDMVKELWQLASKR